MKFVLGMAMALLLNEKFPGRTFVRALFFLPWAIPGLIVGLTWKWMYDGSAVGLLNMLALRLGLTNDLIQWLGNYDLALWAVVVAVVWASTPFWAMMFLAGLQAIPGELYEAAEIDGADVFGRFRHITIPGLANVIVITALLSTIWTATSINFIYVLTNGGPAGATMTFPMLAYQIGVAGAQRLGTGATISLVFFPIFLVMIYLPDQAHARCGALDLDAPTARAPRPPHRPHRRPAVLRPVDHPAAVLDRRHRDQTEPADLPRAVAVPEPDHRRPLRLRADQDALPAVRQEQPAGHRW